MAAHPYILARTIQEAHAFARETLGLAHGHYRVVASVGTIKSIRNVDLYLAPNWKRRYDGFSMKSAIRWTHMNVIDWEERPEEFLEPEPDGLEPAGEQLAMVPVPPLDNNEPNTAYWDEVNNGPTMVAEEPEKPSRRVRRRRCPECGELVEPTDVEQHAADHFPVEE